MAREDMDVSKQAEVAAICNRVAEKFAQAHGTIGISGDHNQCRGYRRIQGRVYG